MTCEYQANLCFVRPGDWGDAVLAEEVAALARKLFPGASVDVSAAREEGLDVAVARVNGLAAWQTEEQLLDWLDARLPEEWWIWLSGYTVEVMPKVDAGPCRLKKRGA